MSYKFFQNKTCEYFPCHKYTNNSVHNCKFCFCPLYFLECNGNFKMTAGIKDCSDCIIPHLEENYNYIIETLIKHLNYKEKEKKEKTKELIELIKKSIFKPEKQNFYQEEILKKEIEIQEVKREIEEREKAIERYSEKIGDLDQKIKKESFIKNFFNMLFGKNGKEKDETFI